MSVVVIITKSSGRSSKDEPAGTERNKNVSSVALDFYRATKKSQALMRSAAAR